MVTALVFTERRHGKLYTEEQCEIHPLSRLPLILSNMELRGTKLNKGDMFVATLEIELEKQKTVVGIPREIHKDMES